MAVTGFDCLVCYKSLEEEAAPPPLFTNTKTRQTQDQTPSSSSTPLASVVENKIASTACGHLYHEICITSYLTFSHPNGTCPNVECRKSCVIKDLIVRPRHPQDEELRRQLNESREFIQDLLGENEALMDRNSALKARLEALEQHDNSGNDGVSPTIIIANNANNSEAIPPVAQRNVPASIGTVPDDNDIIMIETKSLQNKNQDGTQTLSSAKTVIAIATPLQQTTKRKSSMNDEQQPSTSGAATTVKVTKENSNKIVLDYHGIELKSKDLCYLKEDCFLTFNVADIWLAEFVSKLTNGNRIRVFPKSFYTKLVIEIGGGPKIRKRFRCSQTEHIKTENIFTNHDFMIVPINRRSLREPSPIDNFDWVDLLRVDCIAIICLNGLNLSNTSDDASNNTTATKRATTSSSINLEANQQSPYIIIFDIVYKELNQDYNIIFGNLKYYLQVEYKRWKGNHRAKLDDSMINPIISIIPKHSDQNWDKSSFLIQAVEEFLLRPAKVIDHKSWFSKFSAEEKRKEIHESILGLIRLHGPGNEKHIQETTLRNHDNGKCEDLDDDENHEYHDDKDVDYKP